MLGLRFASRNSAMLTSTRALSTTLKYQGGSGASLRSTIKDGNPFWLDHQRTAKEGFHKHILLERYVSAGMLAGIPLAMAIPGNFILDSAALTAIIFHSYHGIANMISDYVPLVAPPLVAPLKFLFTIYCVAAVACGLYFNFEDEGFGNVMNQLFCM